VEAAPDLAQLIRTARTVNDNQPQFVVDLIRRAMGNKLQGCTIAALGLSYKADVDDLRESPAIEVVHLLHRAGARVVTFEPFKTDFQVEGAVMAASIDDAVAQADALLLLVNHTALRSINPRTLATMTQARLAIDTVNGWNSETWQAAGFEVFHLGVRK